MLKLKYTIPLLGISLSIAIIAFQYVSLSSSLAQREVRHARETLTNTANSLQGSLNSHLESGDMVSVKQDISNVHFLPSARSVYLLDATDIIIASGQLGQIGKTARTIDNATTPEALLKVRSQRSGLIFESTNGQLLTAIYPIVIGRNPGEFRPSRIGAVVIEFDLSAGLASLQSSVLRSTTNSALVVLIIVLIAGVGVRFLFTERVSKILAAAQAYRSGNKDSRAALSGRDELADIAQAFDDVADTVEHAQVEIKRRQKSLNNAQRIAHLGNWEWHIPSGDLLWSDEIYRIFGYAPQEFAPTYEAFLKSIHPDDQALVQAAVNQSLETKQPYKVEHKILQPNGLERIVLEVGELTLDAKGEPLTMSGTVLDITEAKMSEQEIVALNASLEQRVAERTQALQDEVSEREVAQEKYRESEERSRQIVNSAVDGIITIDNRGLIKTFNSAAEKLFGFSIIEVIGKNISMLMPKQFADHHDGYLKNFRNTGDAKIIGIGREVIGQRKDKTTFIMELSVSEFSFGSDQTFVGMVRDITERKDAEYRLQSTLEQLQNTQSELVQAEKMASLGGLVAGVAHEINTPIGVGLTAATHLKEQADQLDAKFSSGLLKKSDFQSFIDVAKQSTQIVETNINRASELISSFKQVAVDQSSEEARTIVLLDYIDEILVSLQPKLKRTNHIIDVEGDRTLQLTTNPGALSQIITNLVMNAVIHAFDDDETGHIHIHADVRNDVANLSFTDDGKGMDSDVQAKVFEPFFTTKRGSGGSGLGMHILYNQVTQTLGGTIDLLSKPGVGSAFEISIPLNGPPLNAPPFNSPEHQAGDEQ